MIIPKESLNDIKKKAKNGYQMVRLPRCGTTITMLSMKELLPESKFTILGCGAFSDMPFSWGPRHNGILSFPSYIDPKHDGFNDVMTKMRSRKGFGQERYCRCRNRRRSLVLDKSWILDFNIRLDQRPLYDPNKLNFQIIRNPYDWLISIFSWNFMSMNGASSCPYCKSIQSIYGYSDISTKKHYNTFDEFIEYIFKHDKNCSWKDKISSTFPYPMMDKCFFQAFDNDGNCKVDVFIRYENLWDDIQAMIDLGEHDISFDIESLKYKTQSLRSKVTNSVNSKSFKDYKHKFYTKDSSVQKVFEAYSWDLKSFGYDFDGIKNKIQSIEVPLGEHF